MPIAPVSPPTSLHSFSSSSSSSSPSSSRSLFPSSFDSVDLSRVNSSSYVVSLSSSSSSSSVAPLPSTFASSSSSSSPSHLLLASSAPPLMSSTSSSSLEAIYPSLFLSSSALLKRSHEAMENGSLLQHPARVSTEPSSAGQQNGRPQKRSKNIKRNCKIMSHLLNSPSQLLVCAICQQSDQTSLLMRCYTCGIYIHAECAGLYCSSSPTPASALPLQQKPLKLSTFSNISRSTRVFEFLDETEESKKETKMFDNSDARDSHIITPTASDNGSNHALTKAEGWQCRRCLAQAAQVCFVCGTSNSYLVPTSDGRWIDIVCATWTNNVTFISSGSCLMHSLRVGKIDPALFNQRCCICHRRHGCCFLCTRAGCSSYFHPLCAKEAGLYMTLCSEIEHEDNHAHSHTFEDSTFAGYIPVAFCPDHSKQHVVSLSPLKKDKIESKRGHVLSIFEGGIQNGDERQAHTPKHPDVKQSNLRVQTDSLTNITTQLPHLAEHASPFSPQQFVHHRSSEQSSPRCGLISIAKSPLSLSVNSPTHFAPALNKHDAFYNRRSFHNFIESHLRPLTQVDLLRLGLLDFPTSHAGLASCGCLASTNQIRCAHHKALASMLKLSSELHVPFEEDPSFLFPFLGHLDSGSSENPFSFPIPILPIYSELPILPVLLGEDIILVCHPLSTIQRVTTNAALFISTTKARVLTSEDEDAWLGQQNANKCSDCASDQIFSLPLINAHMLVMHAASFQQKLHVILQVYENQQQASRPRSCLLEFHVSHTTINDAQSFAIDSSLVSLDARILLHAFSMIDSKSNINEAINDTAPHTERFSIPTQSASVVVSSLCNYNEPVHFLNSEDDEICRELMSAQIALADCIRTNCIHRQEIIRSLGSNDWIGNVSQSLYSVDSVIAKYRQTQAWSIFRHSLQKGMTDARIPKHLLNSTLELARSIVYQYSSIQFRDQWSLPSEQDGLVVKAADQNVLDPTMSEEFVVCCVCFSPNSQDSNPILYCDHCNLTVHRICYGIATAPQDNWYCSYCQQERMNNASFHQDLSYSHKDMPNLTPTPSSITPTLPTKSPAGPFCSYPCVFCTYRGGALKPTTIPNQWGHILCSLCIEGARFQDVSKMEPIAGVEEALSIQAQRLRSCTVCGIQYGACVRCIHPQCNNMFHAYCGWFEGYYYRAQVSNNDIILEYFCFEHTPSQALLHVDISPFLPSIAETQESFSSREDSSPMNVSFRRPADIWNSDHDSSFLYYTGPYQDDDSLRPSQQRQTSHAPNALGQIAFDQAFFPTGVLARLRLFQQSDIRKRAREDFRPRDSMERKRRLEKRRVDQARALHEDLYPATHCAVCFFSEAELEEQKKLWMESHTESMCRYVETETLLPRSHYPENRLCRCESCGIAVHQTCYGTSSESLHPAPPSSLAHGNLSLSDNAESAELTFVCDRCAWQCRDIRCELCPRKGGAFHPVRFATSRLAPLATSPRPKPMGWVHAACSFWFEELLFDDPHRLSGAYHLDFISASKRRLRCSLCKRNGPCLLCSAPGCDQALHPICGLSAGLFMQLYVDSQECEANAASRSVRRIVYCARHSPLVVARGVNVENALMPLNRLRQEFEHIGALLEQQRRLENIKETLRLVQLQLQVQAGDVKTLTPSNCTVSSHSIDMSAFELSPDNSSAQISSKLPFIT